MKIKASSLILFFCSLGLITESFSKLRIGGIFGPAEFFFVLAIIITCLNPTKLNPQQFYVQKIFKRFFLLWFLILIIGTGFNFIFLQNVNFTYIHNSVAFLLNMFLIILVFVGFNKEQNLRLIKYFTAYVAVINFLLYVSGISFFWYSIRFSGLAVNPNQLALTLAPLPFFGLYLICHYPEDLFKRLFWGGITLISCIVGWATQSKSLHTAYLSILPIFILWLLFKKAKSPYLRGIFLLFLISFIILFGVLLMSNLGAFTLFNLYGNHGASEANVRFLLWAIAFWNTLTMSPIFGWGPGSLVHLGSTALTGTSDTANTYVGVFVQSGICGILLFGWLFWTLFGRIRKMKMWLDAMPLIALMVFIIFQYMLRHPIFWFVLVWTFLNVYQHRLVGSEG